MDSIHAQQQLPKKKNHAQQHKLSVNLGAA
jgi:hypothetical protein